MNIQEIKRIEQIVKGLKEVKVKKLRFTLDFDYHKLEVFYSLS